MILQFSDGFTSSTAPVLVGGSLLETFTIDNNVTATTITTFDKDAYKTIFAEYELIRIDIGGTYIQQGTIIFAYSGTAWAFQAGNYTGLDMIVDTIANPYEIKLTIDTSTGLVTYDSGNMSTSYSGELKLNLTRIAV